MGSSIYERLHGIYCRKSYVDEMTVIMDSFKISLPFVLCLGIFADGKPNCKIDPTNNINTFSVSSSCKNVPLRVTIDVYNCQNSFDPSYKTSKFITPVTLAQGKEIKTFIKDGCSAEFSKESEPEVHSFFIRTLFTRTSNYGKLHQIFQNVFHFKLVNFIPMVNVCVIFKEPTPGSFEGKQRKKAPLWF